MTRTGSIVINREKCKGCYYCVRACPLKLLEADAEANAQGVYPAKLNSRAAACTGCGTCYVVCPDICVTVYQTEESA